MAKLPTKLVAVRKITSSQARSSFDPDLLEQAANLIIGVEGIINPIVVRRTSMQSYEVFEGHFEYYAAVRAREISLLKGEMIQAIIIEPENEENLLEQVSLLRQRGGSNSPALEPSKSDLVESTAPISHSAFNVEALESQFANLERVFQTQFEELRTENRDLSKQMKALQQSADNNSQSLFDNDVVDLIVNRVVEAVQSTVSTRSGSRNKTIKELQANPLDLNTCSEEDLQTVPGIGKQKSNDIIKYRNQKGSFNSVNELTNIRGISSGTLNDWPGVFVIKSQASEDS